ncbi:MAG: hypothetical protein ACT4O0_10355 [Pseudonocardia sp.]|jgi:hypothetical protein
MTGLYPLVAPVLGQDQRPPNAPEFGGSSPIGLVVILLLFVAVFFLVKSMNTHLRKVPESFDTPHQAGTSDDPAAADAGTTTDTQDTAAPTEDPPSGPRPGRANGPDTTDRRD